VDRGEPRQGQGLARVVRLDRAGSVLRDTGAAESRNSGLRPGEGAGAEAGITEVGGRDLPDWSPASALEAMDLLGTATAIVSVSTPAPASSPPRPRPPIRPTGSTPCTPPSPPTTPAASGTRGGRRLRGRGPAGPGRAGRRRGHSARRQPGHVSRQGRPGPVVAGARRPQRRGAGAPGGPPGARGRPVLRQRPGYRRRSRHVDGRQPHKRRSPVPPPGRRPGPAAAQSPTARLRQSAQRAGARLFFRLVRPGAR
jgi:hypothetical protein